MKTPSTQRRTNDFDQRNVVLQLALGGAVRCQSFDALLQEYGQGPARLTPAQPSVQDQQLILFVLGLAALRRRFGELLEEAGGEAQPTRFPEQPPVDASCGSSSRELLR